MFFAVSKLIGFFTQPSNAAIALGLLGLVLLATRWRRAGRRLLPASVVLLAIMGYSPLGDALLLPLSERFPAWQAAGPEPDGIVILGGAVNPEISVARNAPELNSAAERMTAAAVLARRYPRARIVFSGGSGNLFDTTMTEAQTALNLLQGLGVARERIVLEDRSRTTAENAIFTHALVKPQPGERWLLVTSAYHMPRAVAAFRAAAFPIEAFPVDWRTRGWTDAFLPFSTLSAGLARTDTAVHEWVGLLAYWMSGRSSELLPGPTSSSQTAACDTAKADQCRRR